MSLSDERISSAFIFKFWAPLSATWLMMAVEGPIITALIARLAEPKFNLAAYGVAFAVAMIIESPIIMMLSASITLVRDKQSYRTLRKFVIFLNVLITLLMVVVSIPAVFRIIAFDVLQLHQEVAWRMHSALFWLIPWPAAIGFRRFWQGMLIRKKLTRKVAYGTVVRLVGMMLTALLLLLFFQLEGAILGGISLSVGVIAESLFIRFVTAELIREYEDEAVESTLPALSNGAMIRYYYPLALTSIIGMAVSPILTFFIGHSRMPLESLAILPVVDSFVFIFRSFGFSYQEVGIALLGEKHRHHAEIRDFGLRIFVSTTLALALSAFTPLGYLTFTGIYGLTPTLAEFALEPLKILVLLPGLSALYSLFRAVIINARQNTVVTISTLVEVGCIAGSLWAILAFFNPVGAIAAAWAMFAGRIVANIYLYFPYRRALKS